LNKNENDLKEKRRAAAAKAKETRRQKILKKLKEAEEE